MKNLSRIPDSTKAARGRSCTGDARRVSKQGLFPQLALSLLIYRHGLGCAENARLTILGGGYPVRFVRLVAPLLEKVVGGFQI